jgi:hypothetical protein
MAQGQPASSYGCSTCSGFSNLASGIRANPFGSFKADDFGLSFVNLNDNSITLTGTLHYTGGDPYFQFDDGNSDHRTISWTIPGGRNSIADNVLTRYVPTTPNLEFTGWFEVSSVDGSSFYVFPPGDFAVTSPSWDSTSDAADYDAWQNGGPSGGWTLPFFWAGGSLGILITPYANNWHNNTGWPYGWNSYFTVQNRGTENVQYKAFYAKQVGDGPNYSYPIGLDPDNGCASSYLTRWTGWSGRIYPWGTWSFNLSESVFGLSLQTSNIDVQEDGFVYIALNHVVSSSYATQSITPLTGSLSSTCEYP